MVSEISSETLEPRFVMSTRKQLMKLPVPNMYACLKQSIQTAIVLAENVALSIKNVTHLHYFNLPKFISVNIQQIVVSPLIQLCHNHCVFC